ncbi:MAG: Holliday junction branch migration protein RuvA [Candidatus Izemoplasmatales bacterium]|jgi:Holliday junction DNA helicase RuvA
MYNYMKGIITAIKADYIALEINNIGYRIIAPNPYRFVVGQEVILYLYQRVAEDELSLYGFPSADERDLFVKLISVNGIGPKSAKAILAAGDVSSISNAIETGNAKYLMKFPGIGPKASQQIILDLKGKIAFDDNISRTDSISEVDEALQALGYNQKEVKKVLSKLDHSKPSNELIKDALRLMLK